jgi:hypothetical protein
MDELFGVADFSHIEDVGVAAEHAKPIDGDEQVEEIHIPKV